MMADPLSTEEGKQDGEPLIHPVMANGRRLASQLSPNEIGARARQELERLSEELKPMRAQLPYIQCRSLQPLERLAAVADWRLSLQT
jgi:hypothetical protein